MIDHFLPWVSSALCRSLPSLLAVVAIGAPPLPAQGLRWTDPDPNIQPTLHVREHADRSWTLCFDGWSMAAGIPLANAGEAAVVGVNPGARAVTSSSADVVNGGGGAIANAPLFPFMPDTRVPAIFRSQMPVLLDLFGFLGPITGSVPEAGLASIRFRVQLPPPPLPLDLLLQMFEDTHMGVATADAQANPTGRIFVMSAGPGRVRMARLLYYLFDRGAGTEEINAAGIEGGAPSLAPLKPGPGGSPWTAGRFGSGLRAGTSLDTGFTGDLGVRFTAAWFMRGKVTPAGASPIFSLGNWRMFTGGAAGTGMRCAGFSAAGNLDLADDVQALAALGWVHVALVVDGEVGQAKWYVNGQGRAVIPMSTIVHIPPSATTMTVGSTPAAPNVYDLDEFRLSAGAESAATIALWATRSSAVALPFTDGCGANLRSRGAPTLGSDLDYRVEAIPGSSVLLTLGAGTSIGSGPLPIDLGFIDPALAGCAWYSDLSITLPAGTVPAGGILTTTLRLPSQSALIGLEVYAQALVVGAGGLKATNAHLISIQSP